MDLTKPSLASIRESYAACLFLEAMQSVHDKHEYIVFGKDANIFLDTI